MRRGICRGGFPPGAGGMRGFCLACKNEGLCAGVFFAGERVFDRLPEPSAVQVKI